jgi:hypothetical protein
MISQPAANGDPSQELKGNQAGEIRFQYADDIYVLLVLNVAFDQSC